MVTKRPQVSSCKNRGGAIKNKDQGFGFSMTLGQGRGHRASLARFPWPVPSGKQEATMRAWGTASLTMGAAPSPGAALAGGELLALQVVRAQASEL